MRMNLKKITAITLVLAMVFALSACAGTKNDNTNKSPDELVLNVYAPKSSILAVASIANSYKSMSSYAGISTNYDDSAVHALKIEAGYECDIFISDSEECMDWLDGSKGTDVNPNKNDKISGRTDLFKVQGTDEDGKPVEIVFTVAWITDTKYEKEVQKFLDFMVSDAAQKIYDEYGFELIK